MKAYEFPAQLKDNGKLELPDAILKLIPDGQTVRIIILVNESDDPKEQFAWSKLTAEQFLAGYSEADSVYDKM